MLPVARGQQKYLVFPEKMEREVSNFRRLEDWKDNQAKERNLGKEAEKQTRVRTRSGTRAGREKGSAFGAGGSFEKQAR